MPKKLLQKTAIFSLVSLVLIVFALNKQSFCMNEEEETKSFPLQGGHNLLSAISYLRSIKISNEEEIKNLTKKNQELGKEKEELIDEKNKLLKSESDKTHKIIKEMMKIIGLDTDDLVNYTGSVFAEKCLDRLRTELPPFEDQSQLALSISNGILSSITPSKTSAKKEVSEIVLTPQTTSFFFDEWRQGLLTINKAWANVIWEKWSSQNLTKLELGGGIFSRIKDLSLGDEGAIIIANLLATNPALKTLDLLGNSIGTVGIKSIGNSLSTNSTLIELSLSNNKLGDEGGAIIINALETNSSLTYLRLCDNGIGPFGAKAIRNALLQNISLKALDLWGNRIGYDGLTALIEARRLKPNMHINF